MKEPVIIRFVPKSDSLIAVLPCVANKDRQDMCAAYTLATGFTTISHAYYVTYTVGGARTLCHKDYRTIRKCLHEFGFDVIVYDRWLDRFDHLRMKRFVNDL